ncbi:MAG TPA: hypothetical protein VK590_00075 [Saprospiraceae bacterium]|nr:hypothetical protein [Saprospiraceae bacterium]
MKKSIIGSIAFVLIQMIMTSSCNSPAEKVEDAKENVKEAKEDLNKANEEYLADVENYKKETSARIDENDKIIIDLKSKMDQQKKEVKAAYKKRVAELEEKNAEMKKKLTEYKDQGKDKWQEFKKEFSHDMDVLGNAFKDLTIKNVK